jgi:predicted ATPase/DNA-binding SARP family transcriptional activator
MAERLRIGMLGCFQLRHGSTAPVFLPPQKSTSLLAYLACYCRRPQPREVLIDLLWPEADPAASRLRLRVLLHDLRAMLSGFGAADLLLAGRAAVQLDPNAFSSDVTEFRAALRAAADAAPAERARGLERAAALYGGDLLPGFYEPWVLSERGNLTTCYLETLQQLTVVREDAGDLEGALAAARQAVATDPLREEAHFDVMRLYAASGQPAASLRQYEVLARVLKEELGETPAADARALAEELRQTARAFVVARRVPSVVEPPGPPDTAAPLTVTHPRLPVPLTHFFGREEESARLVEWLASGATRLVTLSGPGGSGKTRLAIAVAGRLRERFGEAVAFVPLAELTDAEQILPTLAATLGLARASDLPPLPQIASYLRQRPWLLVLDNFDHLVEPGGLHVRALLEQVETLVCMVTSRRTLRLTGEQELALLPLPTPRMSGLKTPDALMSYPSVQLFVDRARAAQPGFALSEANAAAVGELCDRLDGLPLAIELAAARTAMLGPRGMLACLEKRFELLVSRHRDTPARHRTLRAAVETSYRLLPQELQRFFSRLSVFRGGWTLEAAEAVCAECRARCLDYLEQLRDSSLILAEGDPSHSALPEVRFRMLETLREYAWEQLTASGERSVIQRRHQEWCLYLSERAFARSEWPELAVWLARLEAEIDNLRAALAWCAEAADADLHREAAAAGLRLATALWWFWFRSGNLAEGRQWLEGALARSGNLPANLRAPAFLCLAHAASARGEREPAESLWRATRQEHERALTLARAGGDRRTIAEATLALAEVADRTGDVESARKHADEARRRMQALGDRDGLIRAIRTLGGERAWRHAAEVRQQMEAAGDRGGLNHAIWLMATLALSRGERQTARELLEELTPLCRKGCESGLLFHALGVMGHLARDEGDYARARACYGESLVLRRKIGSRYALVQSLEDLAVLAGREQRAERAARLWGAAEAFCEALGVPQPVIDRREYERAISEGRAALGDAAFAAAWAEGRRMTLEDACAYALQEDGVPPRAPGCASASPVP